MKRIAIIGAALMMMSACANDHITTMTAEEKTLIVDSPEVMRILTIDSEKDVAVLRSSSVEFSIRDLAGAEYATLVRKMIRTLEDTDGGVGLAAPQIGLNRRVVAVQRVDKEGEPIEVYANIAIEKTSGEKVPGPEGCLSVPDRRGDVPRYQQISISYMDVSGEEPREVHESVSGFAAVIFQHEVDHLDGVLYIDRL